MGLRFRDVQSVSTTLSIRNHQSSHKCHRRKNPTFATHPLNFKPTRGVEVNFAHLICIQVLAGREPGVWKNMYLMTPDREVFSQVPSRDPQKATKCIQFPVFIR